MKKFLLFAALLLATCEPAFAEQILLPNLGKNATGTTSGGKNALDVNINSGSLAPTIFTTGSFVLNSALTTVVTEAAPANAVGFILEASSSNAANIRWAVGAVATTTSGMRLEAGRDSGYVPLDASISIVAESGTLEYQLQWVKK